MRLMWVMVLSKVWDSALTVRRQVCPTETLAIWYSSTRMETFMWAKSTIWIRLAPAVTSSPSATLNSFTVPSKFALTVSPLDRRISRSPAETVSPSLT